MKIIIKSILLLFLFTFNLSAAPLADYRMDECFWQGDPVTDVRDSSGNALDGSAYNGASTDTTNARLNYSGSFDGVDDYVDVPDNALFDFTNTMTLTTWVYVDANNTTSEVIAHKLGLHNNNGTPDTKLNGWILYQSNTDIHFSVRINNNAMTRISLSKPASWVGQWHFIAVTYNGSNVRLQVDGIDATPTAVTGNIQNAFASLRLGILSNGYNFSGKIDEFKLFNTALNSTELSDIRTNESNGLNYDGSVREEAQSCDASIAENSWELIGVPADPRTTNFGVQDLFGDDFNGSNYNAGANGGWVLWKRTYDAVNNDASYTKVDYAANEAVEFGQAYWLGSTRAVDWDVNGLPLVNYNRTNCDMSFSTNCAEIPLTVPSSDGISDGSGIYRYNMTGFIGKTPVDWKDCRFDINGTIYTPEAASIAGYINNTIWQYDGGLGSGSGGQVLSTDYTSCDDVTPGGCKLIPYHGFWIELNSTLVAASVKLLIPGTSSTSLTSLAITPVTHSSPAGIDVQYTAIGTYADGSSYDVTNFVAWHSSNTAAATISSSGTTFGLAHSVASGSTIITASYSGINSNSADLTVTTEVLTSLQITPEDAIVSRGNIWHYSAIAVYSAGTEVDVTRQAVWSSSNTNSVQIVTGGTQAGSAEAFSVGTADISATFEAQTSNTATVEVIDATLQSIVVEPIQKSSAAGVKIAYTATGHYSDNTVKDLTRAVTWTSSDETVASFADNGIITTLSSGTTDIQANFVGISSTEVPLTVTTASLQSIQITPSSLVEPVNTSGQLLATAFYDDDTSQDVTSSVTWVSSNESIFTVDSTGIATLLGVGTATVSASIGAVSDTSSITVTSATLNSIEVYPKTNTMVIGTTREYNAVGIFSDDSYSFINNDVTWSVLDPAVASIDSNGIVTALSSGNTKVIASHNGKEGSSPLTVTTTAIDHIQVIPPGDLKEPVGTSGQLYAVAILVDGTAQDVTQDVTWTSSDPSAVFVSNGTQAGYAQLLLVSPPVIVSATLGTITGTLSIEVVDATLLEIQITPLEKSLANGLSVQYSAKGVYDNGKITPINGDVIWSSSDTTIATIDPAGLAQSIIVGDVNITATAAGISASTPLYITDATVQSLEITPRDLVEPVGTSGKLTATAIYSDTSREDVTSQVTWQSDDPAIAVVTTGGADAGLLELLSLGEANVSAVLETSTTKVTALADKSDAISVQVIAATLESISIEPINSSIPKGSTLQYSAIGQFSNGTETPINEDVSWNSGDATIAIIDQQGVATGQNVGSTTIIATYNLDPTKTASTGIDVGSAELVSLDVEPKNAVMIVGNNLQFTCIALLTDSSTFDVTNEVVWHSSDENIAIVQDGLATGKNVGPTVISSSWTNPDTGVTYSDSASLEVKDLTLTEMIVYADKARLTIGESTPFTAVGIYADGVDQIGIDVTADAVWSTLDNSIASVSNAEGEEGTVTGHTAGETDITATLDGVSDTTPIIVTDALLLSIDIEPTSATLPLGLTKDFTAIGEYDDGSFIDITSEVTWHSSNELVAQVESTGRVVSLDIGESTITASSTDTMGTPVTSNDAIVTVSDSTNISLSITPSTPSIAPESQQVFRAILTVDGIDDDITDACIWSSDDISVATVSNDIDTAGIATSYLDGTAGITAVYKHQPNDQEYSASTTLTVLGNLTNKPSSVRIEPVSPSVAKNGFLQLSLIGVWDASDGGPFEQNLTMQQKTNWKVDNNDKNIVNINQEGLAEGLKEGTAGIEGSYNGEKAQETFTVTVP